MHLGLLTPGRSSEESRSGDLSAAQRQMGEDGGLLGEQGWAGGPGLCCGKLQGLGRHTLEQARDIPASHLAPGGTQGITQMLTPAPDIT